MARPYIILRSGAQAWLLQWNTVCDMPADFNPIPVSDADIADERIARALRNGTSYVDDDGNELTNLTGENEALFNRAGADETCLTIDQIIEHYCVGSNTPLPRGFDIQGATEGEANAFLQEEQNILKARGLDKPTDFTTELKRPG